MNPARFQFATLAALAGVALLAATPLRALGAVPVPRPLAPAPERRGQEALPEDLPPALLQLVDRFLDRLLSDPSLQDMFNALIKEIFKAELYRVEAVPKEPAKRAFVMEFID